ncbi:MAG: LemA family protein, partial [Spirochaetales bacterium]|nr:LemA family protein [Spirochaetales bacterium]
MRKIHIQTLLLLVCSLLVISCNPISIYNNIVEKDEAVSAAWAQVENQYQRRADLIPNLVECVKGYAAHESETLENVIAKRKQSTQIVVSKEVLENEQLFAQYQQAQNALSGALSRLMAVAEAYPNLKANENFIALQSQLEGTENRISVER